MRSKPDFLLRYTCFVRPRIKMCCMSNESLKSQVFKEVQLTSVSMIVFEIQAKMWTNLEIEFPKIRQIAKRQNDGFAYEVTS